MNRKLAVGRLWWKELRQLLPLVGLLFIVGLLLQLLSLTAPSDFRWQTAAIVLGIPGLFAAGAGALLVGQEKELRTFDWLRSLPVLPNDILRTKLLVGLLGLVLVWLVSLALAATSSSLPRRLADSGGEWLWALHSLFLLLLGFATAWQLRSSFISLLILLPLACVPLALANLHEICLNALLWQNHREPRPWVMALYLILCSVAALAWGWRAALVALSPERSTAVAAKHSSLDARASFTAYARSTPAPALLWQFSAQNRAALTGIAALLLTALLGLWLLVRATVLHGKPPSPGLLVALSPLAGFLALSWLGLLVFQGDSLQRRKQFLADRGVSPMLTWVTRMAVPLLMLAIAILLSSLVLPRQEIFVLGFNQWLIGAAALFAIFTAGQWIGQVIRSPIVGAIVSPLISFLVVYYIFFSIVNLGAPWWSVAPLVLLPLVATFAATSAWMDGRAGWRFWCWHSGLLVLCVLLPAHGFLSYMAMYPRMSSASRQQLQQLLDRPGYQAGIAMSWDTTVMTLHRRERAGQIETLSHEQFETVAEYRQFSIANLRSQMGDSSNGLASWVTLKVILSDAIVQRLADPSASDVSRKERYRESLGLLFELTKRQRMSLDVRNQDIADELELTLLRELQMPLAEERMGDELNQSLRLMLGDQLARDRARRAALASSWQRSQTTRYGGPNQREVNNSLGSYDLQSTILGLVTVRDIWEASRRAGLVSERLLKLLDATTEQQRDQLRAEIGALVGLPPASAATRALVSKTEQGQGLLYEELNYPQIPGRLWHGEWEQVAKSIGSGE
ncbi:MAG: hypothetical protein R3C09_15755 [Pirellulaceae bacterium]|jgi:hypothetical protein